MSDESQPEPLRLKPRQTPPPATPAPAPGATGDPSGAAGELPRLRLKPRLGATGEDSAAPGTEPVASGPAQSSTEPAPRLRPRLTPSAESDAAAEKTEKAISPASATPEPPAGFSLKPKLRPVGQPSDPIPGTAGAADSPPLFSPPAAPPAPGSTLPSTVPPAPDPSMAPPIVPAPPGLTFPPPPARPAPGTPAVQPPPPPGSRRQAPPEHRPAFKFAVLGSGLLVAALVGVGGYFAYDALTSPPAPPAPSPVSRPAAKGPASVPAATLPAAEASAAVPGEPVGPARSMPGKMVEKAKAAVAAHDASREDGMADVLGESPRSTSGAAATPPAVHTPPEIDAITRANLPVDVPSAPVETPAATVAPSEAFRAWVSAARVSGVRGGAQARAFINDRLIRQGETVDSGLGIVFVGVDSGRSILRFKDATGAELGKRF